MSFQVSDVLVSGPETFYRKRVGWQTFTPLLYQNNILVANTVVTAQYYAEDGQCEVLAEVQATAAGTANTRIDIELPAYLLPATGVNVGLPLGYFQFVDASGVFYYAGLALCVAISGSLARICGMRDAGNNFIGFNPNVALASGDTVGVNLTYRI